jgi:steroid delta-isomerase-like uncharacterized protein
MKEREMKRPSVTLPVLAAGLLLGAALTLPEAAARRAGSTEANKTMVRQAMDEMFTQGNLAAVDKYVAADYVEHQPMPGAPAGREGLKQTITILRRAFPDARFNVEDVIAEGDKVVVRSTITGTHKGDYMGIAATGKPFTMTAIDILRVQNGKAVEHWGNEDDLGLLVQLGAVTLPAPAAATQ